MNARPLEIVPVASLRADTQGVSEHDGQLSFMLMDAIFSIKLEIAEASYYHQYGWWGLGGGARCIIPAVPGRPTCLLT